MHEKGLAENANKMVDASKCTADHRDLIHSCLDNDVENVRSAILAMDQPFGLLITNMQNIQRIHYIYLIHA